jgi:hypothetical protein
MRLADYECQRLLWLNKHIEAIKVQLSEEWGNLQSAVSIFKQMLDGLYSDEQRANSAKEIVAYMHSAKRYDHWDSLAPGLLRLGLKAELRSILEHVTANRFQNDREFDDVFRAYLALGEKEMALKYAFPWETRASWLLDLLNGWEDAIHGSKSQLLDMDGRNIFEEGITGFRELVEKHPFWLVNFEYLLRFVALNKPLTDRVIAELRACLASLSDEFARSESLDLLKEMFARQPQELPTLSVQRDVVAAIRDRLKIASKTLDHR